MLRAMQVVKTPNGLGTLIAATRPDDGKQPELMVAHARGRLKPELLEKLGRRGPVIYLFYPMDQVTEA